LRGGVNSLSSLGGRLRDARERKNLKQIQVAKLSNAP
jgi:transcriptional regulator with XRE-family HTH domain